MLSLALPAEAGAIIHSNGLAAKITGAYCDFD